MTQALKIDRILDLVELTAGQVVQLTLEMAEVKEELVKKAGKAELAELREGLKNVRSELSNRLDYKFELLKEDLDKKPDRDEFFAFQTSVNENDTVYARMLLDHGRRIKILEDVATII